MFYLAGSALRAKNHVSKDPLHFLARLRRRKDPAGRAGSPEKKGPASWRRWGWIYPAPWRAAWHVIENDVLENNASVHGMRTPAVDGPSPMERCPHGPRGVVLDVYKLGPERAPCLPWCP